VKTRTVVKSKAMGRIFVAPSGFTQGKRSHSPEYATAHSG